MSGSQELAQQHFAIIGAGIAGLSCASALTAAGYQVTLFDKGRGPGGRMASRRFETPHGEAIADHGAQYFTVRDPQFAAQVSCWAQDGLVVPWPEISDDAWVGVPTMNAIIRHMARPFDVRWSSRVEAIHRTPSGWQLQGSGTNQNFMAVALAIPSEQALTFLAQHDFDMARSAMLARFQPCWTGLFAFDRPLATHRSVIRDEGAIGWASREGAKPGRSGIECWVVQATASWSAAHLEEDEHQIAPALLDALSASLGLSDLQPIAHSTHRWRYAMSSGLGKPALWNAQHALGVCGDWLLGPRIECGWLSGQALAQAMVNTSISAAAA